MGRLTHPFCVVDFAAVLMERCRMRTGRRLYTRLVLGCALCSCLMKPEESGRLIFARPETLYAGHCEYGLHPKLIVPPMI